MVNSFNQWDSLGSEYRIYWVGLSMVKMGVLFGEEIHNALKPLMSNEVVLCSDGNSIYQTFAKAENIPHKRIIAIDKTFVVDKIFHIQNLNSYISRLKSWMARFHGVATKYLTHYLGWRRVLEKNKDNISGEFFLLQALRKIDQQLTQT